MNTSDELHAALTEAVATALRELAGVEAGARGTCEAFSGEGFADVSALLKVTTGAGDGYFAMSFTDAVGGALAKRVLTEAGLEPDAAMVRDCLGEVVNVVAGQAKTLLSGTPAHFMLCTPTVSPGAPVLAPAERLLVTFGSELGDFTLHVRLPA